MGAVKLPGWPPGGLPPGQKIRMVNSRQFELEYVADGSLIRDSEPPGWPPQDPLEVQLRAGSVGQVARRPDGVGVLALDGLDGVHIAAPYLEAAFALLRTEPPAYEPCFIHRDFALRNVLWSGDEITGVVDWVETSIGPAWLDVAHCSSNIAVRQGNGPADAFAEAYAATTGREPQPYFDVMDLVGFLPPPGLPPIWSDPAMLVRLEERLVAVLPRCQ